ncbi:sulfatase-like hydrolase/transferase [Lentisphaera profundi]|uniref:Sulfatase-like hydrolase/transferase n=1 Tax=Lentisphaera profundi TaxID=1658616 RepID=A0ABY7VSJ3_9BACT|nr:sulfatase-like hydrolase/transferase [Lentisphaera profundi]WDE97170.1 sulfatase-like hydrolase/transferase [Lentisphaera profundi]
MPQASAQKAIQTLSLLLLGLCANNILAKETRPPNIIVILTDDHGYADFGAYGLSKDIMTPNLDRLSENGAVITNGYATAPQCIPSRAAIVTSRYQTRFGLDGNSYAPMDIKELTIAQRLKKVGYTTGFVGKWHLEPNRNSRHWMKKNWPQGLKQKNPRIPHQLADPYLPMNRGYTDYYDGTMSSYLRNYDLQGKSIKHEREIDQKTFRVDKQTDAALAFIKRNHQQAFYLQLSYFAPHVPIEFVKKHFDRFPAEMAERRRWALASLAAIDDGVGAIMQSLQKYEIEENTIIFYFADNGAPLNIHMADEPFDKPGWDGSINGPMRGEKGMISEGGVRVPYLVYWKGKIPAQVYHKPVSTMDAGATALALAKIKTAPGEIDGVNLLPHLSHKSAKDPHQFLYWRFWGQSAIRSSKWKLLELENGVQMLFDMESSTPESNNLIATHPEIASRLHKKLSQWSRSQLRADYTQPYGREAPWFKHYFGIGK